MVHTWGRGSLHSNATSGVEAQPTATIKSANTLTIFIYFSLPEAIIPAVRSLPLSCNRCTWKLSNLSLAATLFQHLARDDNHIFIAFYAQKLISPVH